ncbi:ATP-binding protein [uncultured Mucilaginibacter sp.]|uniref:ATP-binding protein n=1 Tax=uncultured Mucilaginibacter sp. TaxID=797541 RepID=UPI0026331197|nr:ATP-binding protein [uncultured Mucilaginibacter sp.]
MSTVLTNQELLSQNQELQRQLDEANDTIEAIRTGQVDALIVKAGGGHEVYTLKSADQTYRVFIEKMAEGAVTLDEKGIVLYSNLRFALMLNLPLEKVIGAKFETFVPAAFREGFLYLMQRGWMAETKGEISLSNVYQQEIPFLLSLNTLPLNGEATLSIILTDLTLQKETEHRLKLQNEQLKEARQNADNLNNELENIVQERTKDLFMSQEHFKFLADNIPVIVWTAYPDGSTDYFNKRWCQYTGLTVKQSIDWGWQHVIHPDDLEKTIQVWKKSVETGQPYEIEYRFKGAENGQYRWHLGHAIPFKDESGQIIKWFGTGTDIEDQKKEMEKRDEFISIASHELKTPLTSAKGYIQLIEAYQKEVLPVTVKTFVKKANDSLNKLQTLVNDLLDVSKIQAGKLEFGVERLNLGNLIITCVENATHIYPKSLIVNCYTGDFIVTGNFERLEQVLMNLISNAVKYSNNDHPIDINAEQRNGYVNVSVTDRGIGLTEPQMARIFERFYRVEDKKYLTSGLGMGLYISSEIIKAHGGFMSVKSVFNEGSTFNFNLPLI